MPVTVVPTPVDLSTYHNLEPQRVRADLGLEKVELLLYVGRLSEEKDLDFLLRAFAQVVRVIFNGPVPHSEIPHYVAAADLFVFSSQVDTQGLVLIETMAAGTPVVAVEAPGPVEALAEGGGLLVPAREEAFAGAVLALLADEPRRRTMGERAARAVQRYTIPSVTARLLNVYEEAIAAGPRPVKKIELLREQKTAAETWHKVGDQICSLGESLSTAFSTAWEEGETRQYLRDMRSGLAAMIKKIDQEIQAETESGDS